MYLVLDLLFLLTQFKAKTGRKSSRYNTTVVELWLKWWLLLFLSMQLMTKRMWKDSLNHDEYHMLAGAKPSQVSCFTSQFFYLVPSTPSNLSQYSSVRPTAAYHMQYSTPVISCWVNMINTAGAPVKRMASGQDLRPMSNLVEYLPKSEGFHGSHRNAS